MCLHPLPKTIRAKESVNGPPWIRHGPPTNESRHELTCFLRGSSGWVTRWTKRLELVPGSWGLRTSKWSARLRCTLSIGKWRSEKSYLVVSPENLYNTTKRDNSEYLSKPKNSDTRSSQCYYIGKNFPTPLSSFSQDSNPERWEMWKLKGQRWGKESDHRLLS